MSESQQSLAAQAVSQAAAESGGAPSVAAKTVRSSASDRPIDIAAIQPKQCVAVEESKMVPIYSNNPDRSTEYWPDSLIERHLVHSPETEVVFTTSLDTEVDVEHKVKPLSDGFSILALKIRIKEAHQLDPKYDFDLCGKHSHNLIDFTETTPLTSLFNFDRCQYILAVLNERYQSNSDDNSPTPLEDAAAARAQGEKQQPVNLEKKFKVDKELNHKEKEEAIKNMLKDQFPDIVKDKIGGQKYHCFSKKCRKTFGSRKQLFEHQKIHLKNYRPFECDFPGCNKSFMSKGHLRNHADTHKDQKTYKCPIAGCNESYSRMQRLKVHLKRHNGTKDFVCPFEGCGKAFYEKGNLKTHLRLHTGEKPYHCSAPGCNKSFATQGHLNDHYMKNHQLQQHLTQAHDYSLPRVNQQLPCIQQATKKIEMAVQEKAPQPSKQPAETLESLREKAIILSANSSLGDSYAKRGMEILTSGAKRTFNFAQQQAQQAENGASKNSFQLNKLAKDQQLDEKTGKQAGGNEITPGLSMKRKKILKIDVVAAQNVADDVNAYNAQNQQITAANQQQQQQKPAVIEEEKKNNDPANLSNAVMAPIQQPSNAEMVQDLETHQMLHEKVNPKSAGKKDIATDYMPFFFSFKDYEPKIGQKRGTQTCIKVENRTLNPPTPIKANPEVQLDSNSQNQSAQSKQTGQDNLTDTTQILKQAFGLKANTNQNSFAPPTAKTPLNPRQLAKRRFFLSEQVDKSFEEGPALDAVGIQQKRQNKFDEKVEKEVINQTFKITQKSISHASAEENAQQSKQSINGSGHTFDPRLKAAQLAAVSGGAVKTPSMSQTSNVNDLKELAALVAQEQGEANKSQPQNKQQIEKASENSNVLTFQENSGTSKRVSNQSGVQAKPAESSAPPSEIGNQTIIQSYAQATATCAKQPNQTNNFFGPQNQAALNDQKPQTCQKMPASNSYAFFNPLAIPSESKETPQIENQATSLNMLQEVDDRSKKSLNSGILNYQMLEMQAKGTLPQSIQMQSDVSQNNGSNMLLTPIQSQNLSQTNQKTFNFQQPGVVFMKPIPGQPGLASPLISNQSNLMGQANMQLMQQQQQLGAATNTHVNPTSNQQAAQVANASRPVALPNNRSSSGSKTGANLQRISGSITDRTPSSVRWDKSQFPVSPISHNLSNPSVFFANNPHLQQQQLHNQTTFKVPVQQAMSRNQGAPHNQQQLQQNGMQIDGQVIQQQSQEPQVRVPSQMAAASVPSNNLSSSMLSNKAQINQQQLSQPQQYPSEGGIDGNQGPQSQLSLQAGSGTPQKSQSLADSKRSATQAQPAQNPVPIATNYVTQPNIGVQQLQQVSQSMQTAQLAQAEAYTMMQDQGTQVTRTQDQATGMSQGRNNEPVAAEVLDPSTNQAQQATQQIAANANDRAQMQSIATQYELMSNSSRASSINQVTQQQLDLMKKKAQYQHKIQKIEYQIYVQNQKLMNKAIKMQNPTNFFFSEPVIPAESFHKTYNQNQQAQMMPQSPLVPPNVSSAGRVSASTPQPWMTPWQRQQQQQQQQFMMQQAAMEKQSQQSHVMQMVPQPYIQAQPDITQQSQFTMMQPSPSQPASSPWPNSQRPPSYGIGTPMTMMQAETPHPQQYQQMFAEQMNMMQPHVLQQHAMTPMRMGTPMDPNIFLMSSLSSSSSGKQQQMRHMDTSFGPGGVHGQMMGRQNSERTSNFRAASSLGRGDDADQQARRVPDNRRQ